MKNIKTFEAFVNEGMKYASTKLNGKDVYSTWSGTADNEKDFIKMVKAMPETIESIKVQSDTSVFNPSSEVFKGPIDSSKKAKIIKLVKAMVKAFETQGEKITAYQLMSYVGPAANNHDSAMAYIAYKTEKSEEFAKDMSSGKYGPLD